MIDDLMPWLPTALIGLAVLVIVSLTTRTLHRLVRSESTSFWCPWSLRPVTARFILADRGPVAVASCTELAEARGTACGRRCMCGDEAAAAALDEAGRLA
jgi:hypothetical protein